MKVIATSMCTALLCGTVALAAESSFTKDFVSCFSYGLVTSAQKSTAGSKAAVLITNMYKADGSSSDYKKLKVQLGSNASQASEVTVTKGTTYDITLKSAQEKGKWLHMFAKGNNPSLDCKVSGYFNAH